MVSEVLTWIYTHFWELFVMAFAVSNIKGINDALKGSNGKWQMIEVIRMIITMLVVWAIFRQGTRDHEWDYFSDVVIILLLFSLISMGGLDKVIAYFIKFISKKDDNNQ